MACKRVKMVENNTTNKCLIIAEIGINHNGSIELAKLLIDKAKTAGCDAVKFQKRDVETVYSQEELDKPRESPWGTTTREQKEGIEFSIEEYVELEAYTKGKGMDFIVSCWDLKSLELVEKYLNVAYHKIASALITDIEFLRTVQSTGKPTILSTGMSDPTQIARAREVLGTSVSYILACTSTYPTKPEEVNLEYIHTLRNTFPNRRIGFSNHCSSHLACLAAAALGAECIEFHITLDRTLYGSDQASSIDHAKELVEGIRKIELMLGGGYKKILESEKPIADKLRRK